MGTIWKSIKALFKILWATFRFIYMTIVMIVFIVLSYVIYLLHPIYLDPEPTIPDEFSSMDKISWTFYRYPANQDVYQRLTVYHDGSNEVEITREMGDFDIDMLGAIMPWNPRRDKELDVMVFKRKNLFSEAKGRRLFNSALKSGVLDITTMESPDEKMLVMNVELGLVENSATGPVFIGSPIAYPPKKWYNQIYWQKLIMMIENDAKLKPLMNKRKYTKKAEKEPAEQNSLDLLKEIWDSSPRH